jgi:hypothetical protein
VPRGEGYNGLVGTYVSASCSRAVMLSSSAVRLTMFWGAAVTKDDNAKIAVVIDVKEGIEWKKW